MRQVDNVITFPSDAIPARVVESVTLEEFCAADEAGEYISRHDLDGMVILQWPRVIMIRCPMNVCTAIRQVGTNLDAYLAECLESLDQVA